MPLYIGITSDQSVTSDLDGITDVPGLQLELTSLNATSEVNSNLITEHTSDIQILQQHVTSDGVKWDSLTNVPYASTASHGVARVDGVTINSDDGIISSNITSSITYTVESESEMMGLPVSTSLYIVARSDLSKIYYLNANLDPGLLTNWHIGPSLIDNISSFNGRLGDIVPKYGDYTIDLIEDLRAELDSISSQMMLNTTRNEDTTSKLDDVTLLSTTLTQQTDANSTAIQQIDTRLTELERLTPPDYKYIRSSVSHNQSNGSSEDDVYISSAYESFQGGLRNLYIRCSTFWVDQECRIYFPAFRQILYINFSANSNLHSGNAAVGHGTSYITINRFDSVDGNSPVTIHIVGIPI